MLFFQRIDRNVKELQAFGPSFYIRFLARALRIKKITLDTFIGKVTMRVSDTDAGTLSQVFVGKSYDFNHLPQREIARSLYNGIINQGKIPLIIDAGANIGAASIFFSREYPEARIVAVEPDADTAAICRENIARLPHATIIEAAIGSSPGRVALDQSHGSWGTRTQRSPDADIPIVTIGEIIKNCGDEFEVFLVKIDIEGFEKDLFSNNTEWVEKTSIVMIEPHDWMLPGQATSTGFLKIMALLNREFVILGGDTLVFFRKFQN